MNFPIIREGIKDKIWFKVRDFFYNQRVTDIPVIQNINYSCNPVQKKAIICYLTRSYYLDLEDTSIRRTQPFEIIKIVKILSDFGFTIDIIGCRDVKAPKIIKNKKYDLIFGFGDSFYELTNIQPDAVSILYMTESHPAYSYQEERKRLDYYYERHGRKIDIKRSGSFYKLSHLEKKYSNIITLGETQHFSNQYSAPYVLFPTGLINQEYIFYDKKHLQSRKNFLWLGSYGAIHKGLDLLIDVSNQLDQIVIHICGLAKEERKILRIPKRSNIIDHGHIDIKSRTFLEIVDKCSFIILPSCSEGFSTSIATGMLHGLIPVVMKDTGFNRLGQNAIFLEDFKIDYLKMKLNELMTFDPTKLTVFSKNSFDFARQNFSIDAFEKNFKIIMTDILNK